MQQDLKQRSDIKVVHRRSTFVPNDSERMAARGVVALHGAVALRGAVALCGAVTLGGVLALRGAVALRHAAQRRNTWSGCLADAQV